MESLNEVTWKWAQSDDTKRKHLVHDWSAVLAMAVENGWSKRDQRHGPHLVHTGRIIDKREHRKKKGYVAKRREKVREGFSNHVLLLLVTLLGS